MSIVTRTLPSAPGSYASAAEVRLVSGLSSTNDISDADLNDIILNATLTMIGHIAVRVDDEAATLSADRNVLQLKHGLLADLTGDASVTSNDVVVRFWKENTDGTIATSATGSVTINDATLGVLSTANACPDGYEASVSYAYYTRPLDLNRAKRAVRYLAAHMAYVRVRAPGRISRADLSKVGSEGDSWRSHSTRFLVLYRGEVAAITGRVLF